MEKIRGNGAREDDSARACRSLNEAERDERFNIPGENAEYGRDDEEVFDRAFEKLLAFDYEGLCLSMDTDTEIDVEGRNPR